MQLIDGALITMMYRFSENVLTQHRLSFFPSPTLLEFQNEPEIYSSEEIYADVIDNRVVPVPFRFDYDNRDGVPIDGVHPVSHLTIGQYTNCRIPVSSGLMPNDFVRFVLKHFYNTAFIKSDRFIPVPHNRFGRTLTEEESKLIYISIPI